MARDEAVFATLARWQTAGIDTVLASVVAARGATPRGIDSRMLVAARRTAYSVGGGELEARVIAAARRLVRSSADHDRIAIDLGGGAGAAGVCGGRVEVELLCLRASGAAHAASIAAELAAGATVELAMGALAPGSAARVLTPDPRLIIVGAGHCGRALYRLARTLDFELIVADPDPALFRGAGIDRGQRALLSFDSLATLLDTPRACMAVLLNRDYHADVASLRALIEHEIATARPLHYLGMMGSRRRIATVRAALPEFAARMDGIDAPIGLDIGAETPEEIAVAILARLIESRRSL